MKSIPIVDIFLIILVLVDDWYQEKAQDFRQGKPGKKPEFSDSEVMTLLLAMDFIPFPSETQYLAFIRANYHDLFPRLLDQSQFNRRASPFLINVCWIPSRFLWWATEEARNTVISLVVLIMATVPARKCTTLVTNWSH